MSHHAANWGVPVGVGAVGLLSQAAQEVPFDWLNMTALAAVILIALFFTTKFLPSIQKTTADSQIEFNKTIVDLQEKFTKTIQTMQDEHSTVLKSISLDHKEALDQIVTRLVMEKKDQRESMHAFSEKQLERVITHFDSQIMRMLSLSETNNRLSSNPKEKNDV